MSWTGMRKQLNAMIKPSNSIQNIKRNGITEKDALAKQKSKALMKEAEQTAQENLKIGDKDGFEIP